MRDFYQVPSELQDLALLVSDFFIAIKINNNCDQILKTMLELFNIDHYFLTSEWDELLETPIPIDLAIIDCHSINNDVLEEIIRFNKIHPSTPLIVIYKYISPTMILNALASGVSDLIAKEDLSAKRFAECLAHARYRAQTLERSSFPFHQKLPHPMEEIDRELAAAHNMQTLLLPNNRFIDDIFSTTGVDISGQFNPSSALGGDLWGVVNIDSGQIGIFMCDFSGHGMSAALNTFRLHTLIYDHKELLHSPPELLTRLDSVLTSLLPRGQFATFFYGVIDLWTGQLSWSAAGCPPPIFITQDGFVEALESQGMPLGILGNAARPQYQRPFNPGDSLVLYSDAMTESADKSGRLVGEDGILAMVAAIAGKGYPRSESKLTSWLKEFHTKIQGAVQDDLTAIWIERSAYH